MRAFSRRLLILMEISLFPRALHSPRNEPSFSPAAAALFFLFFFFILSFSYMLSFSAAVFHYYVLSVSRIQSNVYVWVPISIKTFPADAPRFSLLTTPPPPPPPIQPLIVATAVAVAARIVVAVVVPQPPPPPREPVTSATLLFSARRTYFINARPPSPHRPLRSALDVRLNY